MKHFCQYTVRTLCFLLLWYLFAVSLFAQRNSTWATPVDAQQVLNLYKVDVGVYRCAQPNTAAFVELQRLGVSESLNLRCLISDDKYVDASGMTLHHVKMIAANCDWDKVVRSLCIIRDRKGAIVIHCKHGSDRTGLVVALYRIVFQGWTKEEAITELEQGGYGFHTVYANIPSFIRGLDVALLKKAVGK